MRSIFPFLEIWIALGGGYAMHSQGSLTLKSWSGKRILQLAGSQRMGNIGKWGSNGSVKGSASSMGKGEHGVLTQVFIAKAFSRREEC